MEQVSIFDIFPEETNLFKTDKPIRLIELFAGVGAQAMALRNIGADFEHYKISEWDVNSVKSYRAIHMGYKKVEPHGDIFANSVKLFSMGVSIDGKTPLTLQQVIKKGNRWVCQALDDFETTHNIGSVTNIHGKDLGIKDTDKYTYLLTYLLFPLSRLKCSRTRQGHDQRVRDSIRTPVGSRKSFARVGSRIFGDATDSLNGERATGNRSEQHGRLQRMVEFLKWNRIHEHLQDFKRKGL